MACHIRMRLLSFNAEAFRDEMFCQQSTQQNTTTLAMICICRLTVTSNWQAQLACHRSWSPGQQLPARTIVSHRLIKLLMSCMVTASRIQDNRKATKHLRAQSSGYHSYKRVQLRLAPGLRRIAGEQVPANHHKQTMFCHSTNLFCASMRAKRWCARTRCCCHVTASFHVRLRALWCGYLVLQRVKWTKRDSSDIVVASAPLLHQPEFQHPHSCCHGQNGSRAITPSA